MLCAVAYCCLIQAKTLLKGFKRLSTGLADLADDGVGGCAASNAHLKVVTVPMPGLRLGCHTLAILFQLPAAVSSSNFQGCLHVQASSGADPSGRPAFSGIRLTWRRPTHTSRLHSSGRRESSHSSHLGKIIHKAPENSAGRSCRP